MCELFAMTSRVPANVSFSLAEFSRHGGLTAKHKDGWGIAYYHGSDAQIIREPFPAYNSAQMRFLEDRKLQSTLVISHIRLATMGDNALRNTQPFSRELGGRLHVFAHNGMLPDIAKLSSLSANAYTPIGDTDSEIAFCQLLESMRALWQTSPAPPTLEERLNTVREFADSISPQGPSNFIYSDSEYTFCHGHKRTHSDGLRPPGLFKLHRSCKIDPKPIETSGLSIRTHADSQDITLVASVPLTDEAWLPFQEGEIVVIKNGFIAHEDLKA